MDDDSFESLLDETCKLENIEMVHSEQEKLSEYQLDNSTEKYRQPVMQDENENLAGKSTTEHSESNADGINEEDIEV